MNLRSIIVAGMVSAAITFSAVSQMAASSGAAKPEKATATAVPTGGRVHDGQKVFEQNCGRCHNAPQGFPPSISATVSRHMRTRANLSQADMEALLRFLNP
jgi:cytochrome c5